jgi:hypothetical protein
MSKSSAKKIQSSRKMKPAAEIKVIAYRGGAYDPA